jgi:light-regulated signal transduction histidine kinase (bacteriophytochrome)
MSKSLIAGRLSVKDNGPGVHDKYFRKVFQIFQSVSPRFDSIVDSTGIGLTIAELNVSGAWIRFVLGQKSTFYFTFAKQKGQKVF